VLPFVRPRGLMETSYGGGKPTASDRAPDRDCPDMQRPPSKTRPGDRPPVQKSEIAR
jgi:hypothetical protein